MKDESATRTYRQSARAKAAEESAQRILDAFIARATGEWFDEIRLDDVAADAGVTVQTLIRKFGGKDGLLEVAGKQMEAQISGTRQLPLGNPRQAVEFVLGDYERTGDLVMNLLGQELRYPAIRRLTDIGRRSHREWLGAVFAAWLDRLDGKARQQVHDRLVIATDLYVWKLMRRDMGRSRAEVADAMLEMCAAALGCSVQDFPPIPQNPGDAL